MASDVNVCAKCSGTFLILTKSLQCNKCLRLYYPSCVNFADVICKYLNDVSALYCFCENYKLSLNANKTSILIESSIATSCPDNFIFRKEVRYLKRKIILYKKLVDEYIYKLQ